MRKRRESVWVSIIRSGKEIEGEGIPFVSSFGRKVGSGEDTRFWEDRWTHKGRLRETFNRLFSLELDKEATVAKRRGSRDGWAWEWRREPRGREEGELKELMRVLEECTPGGEGKDKTVWSLDPLGGFTVKKLRELLVDKEAGRGIATAATWWSREVPKKVAIFAWRASRDRIATRAALDKMGIDLNSTLCPRCEQEIETAEHALVKCTKVKKLWDCIGRWWNIKLGSTNTIQEIFNIRSGSGFSPKGIIKWQAVVWSAAYIIWGHRNKLVFDKATGVVEDLLFEIQTKTFEWISKRGKELVMGGKRG